MKKEECSYCNLWFAFLQLRAAFKALIFITNLYSFDLQWIYSVNMYKLMFKLKTTLVPHTHTLFLTMEEKLAKMMKYLSHRKRIPSPKKPTFNINKRWDGNTNASEWKVSDVKLNSLVFLPPSLPLLLVLLSTPPLFSCHRHLFKNSRKLSLCDDERHNMIWLCKA